MPVDTRAFRLECSALGALLQELPEADWQRTTSFYGWTIADEIMHLHQVDSFGQAALDAPEKFSAIVEWVRAGQAQGIELSQRMREEWGNLSPRDLMDLWQQGWNRLADTLDVADPERRLPWFGPAMRVQSFANARQMEVWAHGQDIYDLLGIERSNDNRIRTVCDLGVRTHGYAFAKHGLERPAPPKVALIAPGGDMWTWNEDAREQVRGSAVDFALVVTHRRHAGDTGLTAQGEGAAAWLRIAQCFAGEPRDWSAG